MRLGRKRIQTLVYFAMFGGLCVAFYCSLIHATNQYKDDPIRVGGSAGVRQGRRNVFRPTGPPSELDRLMDTAMKWAEQSRRQKLSTLLENPIYKRFKITDRVKIKNGTIVKLKKKKVDILLIVSSGPRRADRRQAIRDTWWTDCVPSGKVCVQHYIRIFFYPSIFLKADFFIYFVTKERCVPICSFTRNIDLIKIQSFIFIMNTLHLTFLKTLDFRLFY